jgi:predicted ATP-dependent endonuclease of OLD family
MNFRFQNTGVVKTAKIDIGKLTVLCGKNNMGKTYVTYALYGFLKNWQKNVDFNLDANIFKRVSKEGSVIIDLKDYEPNIATAIKNLNKAYSGQINTVFSSNKEEFKNAKVEFIPNGIVIDYSKEFKTSLSSEKEEIVNLSKDKGSSKLTITMLSKKDNFVPNFILESFINSSIGSIFFSNYLHNPFLITAERTGIQLFQRELDINKNVLVERLIKFETEQKLSPFKLLKDATSRYFLAIKDNIDFVRDAPSNYKKDSFLVAQNINITKYIEKNVLGIEYKYIDGQHVVSIKDEKLKKHLPFYMTSTSVRSLSDLNTYIKNIAQKGDILMIDEPELNLHPENQIKLARLFVKLINNGLNVFITTHSDYIIKELNNLIMLSNNFKNKEAFMKKNKYSTDEILKPSDIKAYYAEENTLKNIEVDKYGMLESNFDNAINTINTISTELSFYISNDEK